MTNTPQQQDDPLIDEIRAIRAEIMEEVDNDLAKLMHRLREIQREHEKDHPIERLPPHGAGSSRAVS